LENTIGRGILEAGEYRKVDSHAVKNTSKFGIINGVEHQRMEATKGIPESGQHGRVKITKERKTP
jgi:hypothetical protein